MALEENVASYDGLVNKTGKLEILSRIQNPHSFSKSEKQKRKVLAPQDHCSHDRSGSCIQEEGVSFKDPSDNCGEKDILTFRDGRVAEPRVWKSAENEEEQENQCLDAYETWDGETLTSATDFGVVVRTDTHNCDDTRSEENSLAEYVPSDDNTDEGDFTDDAQQSIVPYTISKLGSTIPKFGSTIPVCEFNHAFRLGSTQPVEEQEEDPFYDIKTGHLSYLEKGQTDLEIPDSPYSRNVVEKFVQELNKPNQEEDTWKKNFNRLGTIRKSQAWDEVDHSLLVIRVPSPGAMEYVLEEENFAHVSLQRKQSFTFTDLHYQHHRLLTKSTDESYMEFESKGDKNNLKHWQHIAEIRHEEEKIGNLSDPSRYDYEEGVYVNLYPKPDLDYTDTAEGMSERVNNIVTELKDEPYYVFSSLNCEIIVTYVTNGAGISKQLDCQGQGKWTLCDVLDHLCYYKYLAGLLLLALFCGSVMLSLELMMLHDILASEVKFTTMKFKHQRYSDRQVFKYLLTFLCRRVIPELAFPFCFLVHATSLLLLPVLAGVLYNVLFRSKQEPSRQQPLVSTPRQKGADQRCLSRKQNVEIGA